MSFISAQAEFTPPIIYSQEERARVRRSWWCSLRTVTLPAPCVLACWALLFVFSNREISASIPLVSRNREVIGSAILQSWGSTGMQLTAALAIVQSLLPVTLLAFHRLVGPAVVQ